ncbi:MAG: hypothetical protein WBY88_14945 [Desulfosarcina sp.]
MARSNYKFEKRQKELARKKKKEEKRKNKLGDGKLLPEETEPLAQEEAPNDRESE